MAKPIPVLHVLNMFADGSITRIVERIVTYAPGNEFEWHIGSVNGQDGYQKELEKLNVKIIDFSNGANQNGNSRKNISQYIHENGIRIVHSHTPRTILEVFKALSLSPSIKSQVSHVATKHLLTTPRDRKWGLVYALYDRLALYIPDYLVPVSRTMGGEISAQPFIDPSKVIPIPNAIPVSDYYKPEEREACRKELGLSDQMLVIGFTGRIEKVKNLDVLIAAIKTVYPLFPNIRLLIIGKGNLQPALEAQAERSGISHALLWPGYCANIPRMLAAMDIYVQPSVNEGLSLSILEAMAAGKPVIATRVGSANEILQDRQTGILVKQGSESEISNAIIELINNSDLRYSMANQGRQFVSNEYNIQKMVDGYCDIYRNINGTG